MNKLVNVGIRSSSFRLPAAAGAIWTESNWPLTGALANDNNTWITPTELQINDYSGNGNTELVQYFDAGGFEVPVGTSFQLTVVSNEDPSTHGNGELEVKFYQTDGSSRPEYVNFNSTDSTYTVSVSESNLSANLRGITFFNSFSAPSSGVTVTNAEIV